MCKKHKILHKNDLGYISICKECDHLHMQIGSFMSLLCIRSFQFILNDFKEVNKNKKQYTFPTPTGDKIITRLSDSTFITLAEDEFDKAVRMLEISNHLMSAYSILDQN
jgi:hypothetical protein